MAALISGMPQWVGWAYGAVALLGAVTDYRTGKIYNWLTLPALAFGLGLAGWFGWDVLAQALAGAGVAAAIFIPLFFLGVFGGGDVKLMLALGSVLGARGTLDLTMACFLIGGIGALILLFAHRRARIFFSQLLGFLRSLATPGLELQWPQLSREIRAPFGPAIFAAFLFVILGAR